MLVSRRLSVSSLLLVPVLTLLSHSIASQDSASAPKSPAEAPSAPAPRTDAPSAAARVPVIVELFTSEGCSSCPPADKFLAQIDLLQPVPEAQIIALEEHVDYWDHGGWKDRFSDTVFTARQRLYAQQFRLPSPATPEVVVAGRAQFMGNDFLKSGGAILEATRSPHAQIALTVVAGPEPEALHASIRVEGLPAGLSKKDDKAEVRLAITEDDLASQVKAGENSGKHLEHRATVRKFLSAGEVKSDKPFSADVKVPVSRDWNRAHMHVVVFLEGHGSHEIIGAVSAPVPQ